MDARPSRPIYLPAQVSPNPANPVAGGSFTTEVTLNIVAQTNVTVNLAFTASGPVSPFSGAPPTSLVVPSGQITGTSLPVTLKGTATGQFTITASTPDGSASCVVMIGPVGRGG